MKLRRIIAAVLCGVMLTGCQADERPQSSATESVSTTVPEVTTTATTKTSTRITTIQTTTAPQTTTASKINIETVEISSVVPSEFVSTLCEINYYLPVNTYPDGSMIEVYWGDSPYDMSYSCSGDIGEPVVGALYKGENYYKIRIATPDEKGEFSSVYHYSNVPKTVIHQYTHTFETTYDGWTIIPDYSLAIEDINNGIQPTKFKVSAQWTCPLCGFKFLPTIYTLSYTENDRVWLYDTKCGKSSCPNRKSDHIYKNYLTSYAIQIS